MQKVKAFLMAKTGRPKKDTEQICVRYDVDVVSAIDELRKKEDDLPSRPEMLRRIVDRYLEDQNG